MNPQIFLINVEILEKIIGPVENSKIPLDEKRHEIEQWVLALSKKGHILSEDEIKDKTEKVLARKDSMESEVTIVDEIPSQQSSKRNSPSPNAERPYSPTKVEIANS